MTSREKFPDLHIESYHDTDIVGTEGVDVRSEVDTELQAGQELVIGYTVGKSKQDLLIRLLFVQKDYRYYSPTKDWLQ